MTTHALTTRAELHSLFERLPEAVFVLDAEGRIRDANPAASRFVDAEPEDLRGTEAFAYVAPADRRRTRAVFEAVVADPELEIRRTEFRLDSDGDPVWLEGVVVDSTADPIDGYVVTVRDVTDHRHRERDLERLHDATNRLYAAESTRECFRIAIEAAVTVLGFDWCAFATAADTDEFVIAAISENAPLTVGDRPFRTDEGIAGAVYTGGESSIVDDVRESSRGKPTDESIRSALTVPVGEWGVFQAVATESDAFDDRDRNRAELLVTAMLTAKERIERQRDVEAQNERLDNFVRYVTHDLRTPLTTAAGYLDLVEADLDRVPTELAFVKRAHERMDAMIDQLSTWARGDDLVAERSAVALEVVARRAWSTTMAQFERDGSGESNERAIPTTEPPVDGSAVDGATPRSVSDEVDGPSIAIETERTITADPTCLQQLFENLFRNAVTHAGSDVAVRVTDVDGGFAVEDDGPGIPEAERADVFTPGHTDHEAGTGLGLAIVSEIVDAHGWRVEVTAGSDGGARFEITGVGTVD